MDLSSIQPEGQAFQDQGSSGGMLSDRTKSLHLHHANNGEAHMPEALQTLSAVVIDDAVVTDRFHRFQGDRSQLTTRNDSATFNACLYPIFLLRAGLFARAIRYSCP